MALKKYMFVLPDGTMQLINTPKQSVQTVIEAFVKSPQLDKDIYGRYEVTNVNAFKAVVKQALRD